MSFMLGKNITNNVSNKVLHFFAYVHNEAMACKLDGCRLEAHSKLLIFIFLH